MQQENSSNPAPLDITMSKLAAIVEPMPGKIVVLVRVIAERTPTGLFIPEETARTIHEERANQGIVVRVSADEDDDLDGVNIKVGDTVLFGKFSGFKLTYQPTRTDPKEIVIVMERKNVFAKLTADVDVKVKQ